jgi:tRNA-specific adenosine deaminase 3
MYYVFNGIRYHYYTIVVHSRIKAVYYQDTRAEEGGLNNNTQINNMKTLNHRYQVFHK